MLDKKEIKFVSVNNDNKKIAIEFILKISALKDINENVVLNGCYAIEKDGNTENIVAFISFEKFNEIGLIRYFIITPKYVEDLELNGRLLSHIVDRAKEQKISRFFSLVKDERAIKIFKKLGFIKYKRKNVFISGVNIDETKFKECICMSYDIAINLGKNEDQRPLSEIILDRLKVKIGEEFGIEGNPRSKFKFVNNFTLSESVEENQWICSNSLSLSQLIEHPESIIKLPIKPLLTEDEKWFFKDIYPYLESVLIDSISTNEELLTVKNEGETQCIPLKYLSLDFNNLVRNRFYTPKELGVMSISKNIDSKEDRQNSVKPARPGAFYIDDYSNKRVYIKSYCIRCGKETKKLSDIVCEDCEKELAEEYEKRKINNEKS